VRTCLIAWALAGSASAGEKPIAIPPPPTAEQLAAIRSFGAEEPVIATHYFYWYRWPDEHFFDDAAHSDTALRHHFPNQRAVSFQSGAWHQRQMRDLLAAGIDVALCVYWGAPNQYDKQGLSFSVLGLPPLVTAVDELDHAGKAPRIGMFYDTSTLLGGLAYKEPGRGNVDLRTDEGKDIFYRTIRDFFCQIPPRHWACIDGRPIVALYDASFAAGHDQSTLEYTYEHFARDFAGRRPFIVTAPSWAFRADAKAGWGAALNGPITGERVLQIGPGYDDSPVPERTTPTRDRLAGGFYAASWLVALQAKPQMIFIETWSEMHEGTDICESVEEGRFYIDLTRRYAELFKKRQTPPVEEYAKVLTVLMNGQRSNPQGREFASWLTLNCHVDATGKPAQEGLRLCGDIADGRFEITEQDGVPCVRTQPGVGTHQYLYFDVADPYYYDHHGSPSVRVTYFDEGREPIELQYDSTDDTGAIRDRYKPASPPSARDDSKAWKTAVVQLPGARLANRQNGGADFRFLSRGHEMLIRRVEFSKLPDEYATR
jgi:hypothetical protein